jgi:hypothetical protein
MPKLAFLKPLASFWEFLGDKPITALLDFVDVPF